MNVFEFIVGLSLISTLGWLVNNWIRARHGFEPVAEEEERPSRKRMEAMNAENAQLRDQIKRLEDRMQVMERIATDPATRTAREIEELR